jgi:hypothetical protein
MERGSLLTALQARLPGRRVRPDDGGIVWHARVNVFECQGCGDLMAQGRRTARDPERLAMTRELLVLDHTECWEYGDPRMARLARRYRSEVKRLMLLRSGVRDQRSGVRGRT